MKEETQKISIRFYPKPEDPSVTQMWHQKGDSLHLLGDIEAVNERPGAVVNPKPNPEKKNPSAKNWERAVNLEEGKYREYVRREENARRHGDEILAREYQQKAKRAKERFRTAEEKLLIAKDKEYLKGKAIANDIIRLVKDGWKFKDAAKDIFGRSNIGPVTRKKVLALARKKLRGLRRNPKPKIQNTPKRIAAAEAAGKKRPNPVQKGVALQASGQGRQTSPADPFAAGKGKPGQGFLPGGGKPPKPSGRGTRSPNPKKAANPKKSAPAKAAPKKAAKRNPKPATKAAKKSK